MRRFLAQCLAKKRRWAVVVMRGFVKGFLARNQPINDANKKFISFVRYQYLIRLTKQLPKSVMDKSWPNAPESCIEVVLYFQNISHVKKKYLKISLKFQTNEILRKMYMQHMVGRYCKSMSPARRRQFEMKVLAESVFEG